MTLPKWIFVQEKKDGDGVNWLDCSREQGATVDDDGSTQLVGTYQLVKKLRMRKSIEIDFPAVKTTRKKH